MLANQAIFSSIVDSAAGSVFLGAFIANILGSKYSTYAETSRGVEAHGATML
jgi:hypothetical protein